MVEIEPGRRRTYLRTCRLLAAASLIAAVVYLKWLLLDAVPENMALYTLLIGAELFNIVQAGGFWYTISTQKWTEPGRMDFAGSTETVDIFITVYGEPYDIVRATMFGAMAIRHPRKKVWILDDGPSDAISALALTNGVGYLTRPDRRGAKAGNINDALARTSGEYVVILDADHVPDPEFLEATMGAFSEKDVAFVQTPQSYENRTINRVAAGAHEQQELFYGPIMRGRNSCNAAFSCGTNVIFRRAAFEAVGGMPEDSITEDLRVTLMLLREGYRSEYVSRVLAHGMGPLDVGGFFSQQLRWARGGLEILFKRRPFFRGMGMRTRFQFALSFIYWFTGMAYFVYLLLPIVFLVTGERPVHAPNAYPIYFLPYITITLLTMAYASDFGLSFRALWFTLASFPIHFKALLLALVGRRARFIVTSKGLSERSLRPVATHVVTIVALVIAICVGLILGGVTPAVTNNVAFALGHILIMQGFVRYASRPEAEQDAGFVPEAEGEGAL